ncbi:uncharacterized protein LOC133184014 [Saccostrea echinata]|uniref:uncharacterized protein LOC133184014 n=1 Tax=Saccostrea echinata TaxID=191078 RepID=UPI002A81A630|nr:uncharacterized protein LOC133184014 [Saccostrea echinata]
MEEMDVLYDIIVENPSKINETIFEAVETPLAASTPKRKPSWSDLEQSVLIEFVSKNEQKLFGKFKGPGRGKVERETSWEDVARAVNEVGIYFRTGKEASKQYANLKARAKINFIFIIVLDKLSQIKRPKTGGGPKPPSPTPVEQAKRGTKLEKERDQVASISTCSEGQDSSSDTYTSVPPRSNKENKKEQSLLILQKDLLKTEKRKLELKWS